jgi:broad specificity phosphatase PhoE
VETLLLARHAYSSSNRDGVASCVVPGEGLTPEGVEQARRAARALAGEELSLGVSSELARTRETLELVLNGRDVPRLRLADLDEIDFGSFDGGPLATYREWAARHSPAERAPGGGESRGEAAGRFARGLAQLLERPERVVLAVGHALAIRYVLDAARGLVPAPLITPVEHATPYRLDAREVEAAARLLADWSRSPHFRDPSAEGRA